MDFARFAAPMALACALGAASACSQAVTDAGKAQQEIAMVCAEAAPLAALYPAVGVYVTAACADEEAIAKLALSPGGLAWLEQLYRELATIRKGL
jgi:hypothetical protein